MPDPSRKDLLKKLSGKQVLLTTRCGTFDTKAGTVKEVFEGFFLFLTRDERAADAPPIRNWIWMENVAVLTESPRVETEDLPITRFEM